jgi:phage/plasmid-like protein (TIGR03299 family)
MAHNLSYNKTTGKHEMFAAGSVPWHKLGQLVQSCQTWEQAIELAGLNWTVSKRQLDYAGQPVPAWGIFRDDNTSFLGAVGSTYQPIQNKSGFDFIDTLLEVEKGAHYESAGALGSGERVWCLAKIPFDFDIAGTGDAHQTYLLFTTSHDGSSASQCQLTTVRVVCQNTLNMAINGQSKNAVAKIRHTKNSEIKMQSARDMMAGTAANVSKVKEKLEELASRKMDTASSKRVFDQLFPLPESESGKLSPAIKASLTKRENLLAEILSIYDDNDGNAFPETRGSAFNMLNAITNYTDHRKSYGEDELRAASSALFGVGNQLKQQAVEVLLQETTGAQRTFLKRNQTFSSPSSSLDTILDQPISSN